MASALAYAHGVGIVHRDLKPSNVLLCNGDPRQTKIIDFGLAKFAAEEGLTRLTDDQELVGSPLYWAPEQSTDADVGPAADVYALGGIAYFAITRQAVVPAAPDGCDGLRAPAREAGAHSTKRTSDVAAVPGLDAFDRGVRREGSGRPADRGAPRRRARTTRGRAPSSPIRGGATRTCLRRPG